MGWWDEFNDVPGGNALRYYLGPAYEPINALTQFAVQSLPSADAVSAVESSGDLMRSRNPLEVAENMGWLGASVLGMALPGSVGAVREAVEEAPKGIRAYHGSPHDFDRFSMDKIGTGEGAQAYGHGLYFAEKEGVARSYRDDLTANAKRQAQLENVLRQQRAKDQGGVTLDGAMVDPYAPGFKNGIEGRALRAVKQSGDVDGAIAGLRSWGDKGRREVAAWLEQNRDRVGFSAPTPEPDIPVPTGHMYEVNINASPDDFLDWDKPLSEQPKARDAIAPLVDRIAAMPDKNGPVNRARDAVVSGEGAGGDFYRRLEFALGKPGAFPEIQVRDPQTAQSALREAGIPGIRYLDAGSRGAGDGSRNYVVFDDSLVSILRKYGLAGLLAGGAGANALANGEDGI